MKIDFTGKRVLVTGSTRGIGRAIAEAFRESGARVAVNGSSVESTASAVAGYDAASRVVAAPGSVATADGCRAIVDAGYRIFAETVAAQKRIAEPREIAGPVLYLASELASFVTGSIHVVDGGETAD